MLFPERDLRWPDRRQRMARDHRRLRVFEETHQLVFAIYQETRLFRRDEWFGIRAQVRRAAVSIASNLVEGSARRVQKLELLVKTENERPEEA
jgi:hypothetical protein